MNVKKSQNSVIKMEQSAEKTKKADIQARIQARFGDKAKIKAAPPKPDTAEVGNSLNGEKKSAESASEVTRERLRGMLKMGGFKFSDKERKALGQILK